MTEKQIQNAILREFGTKPWIRLWRQNTGVARIGKRVVRFGVPGQADLTGILFDGRRIEIEIKSATGRQTEDQKNFQAIITRFKGVYILARSISDVYEQLGAHGVTIA